MKHLVRAGALFTFVLLFAFVGIRAIPAPEFLSDFGFHQRNQEANEQLWKSQPINYVNSSICVNCHAGEYGLWAKGDHVTVTCENCHGPALSHIGRDEPEVLDTSRALCSLCHASLISRPTNFPQVNMDEMGGDDECITCHNPHEPRIGIPPEVMHTLEGRTDCQVCHGEHDPWEEQPPAYPHAEEGYTDCLSCHGGDEIQAERLPHIPEGLEGTDCLLCHNPGGFKPLPDDHIGRPSATCSNCHQAN